jgi:two-component system, NarL family, sensor histidine kinase BarA
MLTRLRRLNISLAAKCQLLFGAAVVIIIAAALFVPWQRMEQLTEQLNDDAAGAIADSAVRQHANNGAVFTAQPAQPYLPRLMSIHPNLHTTPNAWETHVLTQLADQPDIRHLSLKYKRHDGTEEFRYSQVVTLQHDCVRCHTSADLVSAPVAATMPTTAPFVPLAHTPVIGIMTVEIPSQTHSGQLLLNRVFILTAGLLAGTLAIIVFSLITTQIILHPVRVLQETAEKVSQGDLNIRSDISTGDEFEQLSVTLNTMLTNLQENADQLRAANKSLDMRIGQLAESNVALYESNRLKSEFLANVSHELRTPLNSILGFAELLKESAAADARSTRFVQNILQSGKNLLDLINDLLDLAKIEAGRMEVRSEPLSLNDLFEGLASILKPLTEAKSLTLRTAVATEVPILHTDPPKLQQVLYNLLSNAIKFSPPNEAIELDARPDPDGQIRISVVDHGPGIEPEKHELIFEKFRQIDGSVTRQHSGTGLGLAISKDLTSLLGGSLTVRSIPGEGATFSVVLPLKITPGVQDMRAKLILT